MNKESAGLKVAWVLAASPSWDVDGGTAWLPAPHFVVVADGGAHIADELGLIPDIVVGDFDSSAPDLIARWREAGIEVRAYQHETKWETDTELALLAALEAQPDRVYILGGTGGRFDHTVANLLLLSHPAAETIDVRLIDGQQELFLAKRGIWNHIDGKPGDTVTLLPLGCDAVGVSLKGMVYPLNKETLPVGRGRGVSNEIRAAGAQVRFEQGMLLVVVAHM